LGKRANAENAQIFNFQLETSHFSLDGQIEVKVLLKKYKKESISFF